MRRRFPTAHIRSDLNADLRRHPRSHSGRQTATASAEAKSNLDPTCAAPVGRWFSRAVAGGVVVVVAGISIRPSKFNYDVRAASAEPRAAKRSCVPANRFELTASFMAENVIAL